MVPARLNVVTLVSDDVPALREFYAALGWTPAMPPRPDFQRFALAGAQLTLWTAAEADEVVGEPLRRRGREFRGFTLAVAVDRPERVDEALEAARSGGAEILSEATDQVWGGRSGDFADPDGNVWEVVHIPGTALHEDGALSWPVDPEA
jgi:catechol 2,3-dioxygenase-like lactoylglutathione lyase family enzyme